MSNHDQANILMVDDQPGKLLSYEAILKGSSARICSKPDRPVRLWICCSTMTSRLC